ncbi:uncharacterized protein LOC144628280 isoform X1 [Oculina patagonica]
MNTEETMYSKGTVVLSSTFVVFFLIQTRFFTDASLIGNYDIKRCYEVDFTFHYQIPGGLTNSTIANTTSEFSSLFQTMTNLLTVVPQCIGVNTTRKEITSTPPGATSVFFKVPVIFTASSSLPDNQVSSTLTNCINTAKTNHKGIIDNITPGITEGGITYTKYNLSTISDKRSCCGGDIPPPCCNVGSANVSSTKCGCMPGFHFVPSSSCIRCPSDTYQDKQGQTSCENCPVNTGTFGKTGMTSKSNCSADASFIGNYDIKRCYEVDFTFHYQIQGGLTNSTIANTTTKFSSLFQTMTNLLTTVQQCLGVNTTRKEITSSPPGVNSVFFKVPVIFTASSNVPDDQVSSKLTNCINTVKSSYKGFIDSRIPTITEGDVTYTKYNLSTISHKRSCCGGDIPPPCCNVGSVNVSSTKCGCVTGFHFVPSSSCVRCPSDTYQNKQGQTSCENCPVNTGTFGKTGMTSKSNCSASITPNSFYHIGCFNESYNRTMPIQLGNWRHDSQAVQKCALAAEKGGYSVFGVQNAGECWSGPQAHMTYKKYGSSTRCVNGTGGTWAQDVYAFFNASLIANYDIKRCYEVDFTFHYQIPGGLTSNTINKSKSEFSDFFRNVSSIFALVPECSGVTTTSEDITASPPGATNIFFRLPIVFTASKNIPEDQVSSKLISCINTAKSNHKGFIDNNTPKITEGGVTYTKYNLSTISDKRSCCGGDIPPPCCAAGSIKASSTKCGCVPGFHFVPSSVCARCPLDTYQDEQGQKKCKKCPAKKQTFGKTGMTRNSNCSDTNPLQLRDLTAYLTYDIKPGTVVTNVTVTGKLASLVQPFIFYIDNVVTPGQQSRGSLKRRRRDIADVCEEAGKYEPLNYFCIHRKSGQLKVTQDFVFKDGDEFDLKIRVTDSDRWGKTENRANFKLISRDDCNDIRTSYDEAVKFCKKDDSPEPARASSDPSCPSAQCLVPLYDRQEKLNASEKLKADCSFDPENMAAVMQKYSSCIGPPIVTLNPVPQTLKENAPAILTCNASSPLQVKITWFKNGTSMERYGSQLKIDSFQYEDQGDYYCSFATYLTSSLSKPALLVLEEKQDCSSDPHNMAAVMKKPNCNGLAQGQQTSPFHPQIS